MSPVAPHGALDAFEARVLSDLLAIQQARFELAIPLPAPRRPRRKWRRTARTGTPPLA